LIFYFFKNGGLVAGLSILLVLIAAIIVLSLITSALKGILSVSLYSYSETGRPGFDIPEFALEYIFSPR
jgi:hypothetical protein